MNFRTHAILGLVFLGLLSGCSLNREVTPARYPSVPPPHLEPSREKSHEAEKMPPQELIVLLPEPDGKVGKIRVTTEGNTQVIDRPWVGVKVEDSAAGTSSVQPMGENEIREVFGAALEVHPDLPNRFVSFYLWFESDTAKLTSESRKTLKEILKAVKNRKPSEIYVAGHTDRVGSETHNLKLSAKRASYIKDYLVANGIKPSMLILSHHGESAPLLYTADEVPEPSNRRVEVYIK
jgi:outer membrane protein OmpA-like peptidoglycan-associated protein